MWGSNPWPWDRVAWFSDGASQMPFYIISISLSLLYFYQHLHGKYLFLFTFTLFQQDYLVGLWLLRFQLLSAIIILCFLMWYFPLFFSTSPSPIIFFFTLFPIEYGVSHRRCYWHLAWSFLGFVCGRPALGRPSLLALLLNIRAAQSPGQWEASLRSLTCLCDSTPHSKQGRLRSVVSFLLGFLDFSNLIFNFILVTRTWFKNSNNTVRIITPNNKERSFMSHLSTS